MKTTKDPTKSLCPIGPRGTDSTAGALWALLSLVAATFCACSGDGPDEPPAAAQPPSEAPSSTEYSVKVYAGTGDGRHRIDLPPIPEISGGAPSHRPPEPPADLPPWFLEPPAGDPGETAGGANDAHEAPSLGPNAVVGTPNGSVEVSQAMGFGENNWRLVQGASRECGRRDEVLPPWKPGGAGQQAFFLFNEKPRNCDCLLAYQTHLQCVAQKLKDVADAVETVHWEGTKALGAPYTGPWDIPPQSATDRFILRDAAMYILAHVTWFDAWKFESPLTHEWQTCAEMHADVAKSPQSWEGSPALSVFEGCTSRAQDEMPGVAPKEPLRALDPASVRRYARARLLYEAHILRDAGRKVKDIVEKSVDADLAGAESRRARAADPEAGARAYWGLSPRRGAGESAEGTASDTYNSVAHATRVVAGRWELGPFGYWYMGGPDPRCSSVGASDLLKSAYGPDFAARHRARDLDSSCQEATARLIEQSGIVLPEAKVSAAGADWGAVRSAVADQIVTRVAVSNGYAPDDAAFRTRLLGKAIADEVAQIPDTDLRLALEQSAQVYRALTSTAEGTPLDSPAVQSSILRSSPTMSPLSPMIEQLGGIVFADGLPRMDLAVDAVGRAGGMQEASQCDGRLGPWSMLDPGSAVGAPRAAFQDAFSMGQSLMRRLVLLHEMAKDAGATGGTEAAPFSLAAAAEIRTWAGGGRLVPSYYPRSGRVGATIRLFAAGFDPADWGVGTPEQMANQLVLVHGEPWVAECAARLRKTCPADFESKYVVKPLGPPSIQTLDGDAGKAMRRQLGLFGNFLLFDFPAQAPGFNPTLLGQPSPAPVGVPSPKHLYAVLRHDPQQPSRGKVLGAMSLRLGGGGTMLASSDRQRDLLNRVLGTDSRWAIDGARPGRTGRSFARGSCLNGVPRDPFVPLENELTSDSDQYESSWRHYLTLARQAANKADELGRRLVEIGLQKDLRREAAMEEAGQICGVYPNLNDAEVRDGHVTPKDQSRDSGLAVCLNEDKTDIVFLTEDQTPEKPTEEQKKLHPERFSPDRDAFIREHILRCNETANASHRLCSKNPQTGEYPVITTAGLGVAGKEKSVVKVSSCDAYMPLVDQLTSGFPGDVLRTLNAQPWLTTDSMKMLAASLKMRVSTEADGAERWTLDYVGTRLMDSGRDQPLWPGCARDDTSAASRCTSAPRDTFVGVLDRMYHPAGLSTPIGGSGLPMHQELAMLRWRVEASLWVVAGWAGAVPEKMFSKPIPIANFTTWEANGCTTASALTIYGRSMIDDSPPRRLTGERDDDAELIGATGALPSPGGYPSSPEVPPFLTEVHAKPQCYRVVDAQSSGATLARVGGWSSSVLIQQLADSLDGIRCNDNGKPRYHGWGEGETETHVKRVQAAMLMAGLKGEPDELAASMGFVPDRNDVDAFGIALFPDQLRVIPVSGTRTRLCRHRGDAFWMRLMEIRSSPTGALEDPQVQMQTDVADLRYYAPTVCWPKDGNLAPWTPDRFTPAYGLDDDAYLYTLYDAQIHGNDDQRCATVPIDARLQYSYNSNTVEYSAMIPAEVVDQPCPNADLWCHQYRKRSLLPRVCGKHDRLPAFVNSYAPPGACGAAAQLAQAIVLACHVSTGDSLPPPSSPPKIETIDDLQYFSRWLDSMADRAAVVADRLYLQDVPKRVIDDVLSERVGSGNNEGEHGRIALQMGNDIRTVVKGWSDLQVDIRRLAKAYQLASIAIRMAEIEADSELTKLTIEQLQAEHRASMAAIGAASAWAPSFSFGLNFGLTWNPFGGASATAQAVLEDQHAAKVSGLVDKLKGNANDAKSQRVLQALTALESGTLDIYKQFNDSLSSMQKATADALGNASALRQAEAKARYEMAKGLGADYYEEGGNVVELPVNTVLRREYNITRIRYQRALDQAKYLSFVARLAIEQRIGTPLVRV